jgi:DNA repair protein RecN (Recombination protein N)
MLVDLRIQNYALIEALELRPSALLNIITGETGAGKSIMLGAIGLLLGNRADSRMLFNTGNKCVIEGQFDISSYQLQDIFDSEDLDYDAQCILRREISPTGKSRAFVNDTPVTLETLRKIGANLMDIHSQHDTLLLGDAVFQLNLLDLYAGLVPTRGQYSNAYRQYRKLEADLKTLENQVAQANKELDYHSFLLSELEEARLDQENQEELEQEIKQLAHRRRPCPHRRATRAAERALQPPAQAPGPRLGGADRSARPTPPAGRLGVKSRQGDCPPAQRHRRRAGHRDQASRPPLGKPSQSVSKV